MDAAPCFRWAWFWHQPEGRADKAPKVFRVCYWYKAILSSLVQYVFIEGFC